jgi:xanthine dehydrogenase accessory factor
MSAALARLRAFLAAWPQAALVEVGEAKGSTPREEGAWMLVSPAAIFGTIGGGQLEFMAIDKARELLGRVQATSKVGAAPHPPSGHLLPVNGEKEIGRDLAASPSPRSRGEGGGSGMGGGAMAAESSITLDVPLGPQIGQCCGGRVKVEIALADAALRAVVLERVEREEGQRPHVVIFGGGHVGHALADALSLLPLAVSIVETRPEQIGDLPQGVEARLTAMPEEVVRGAPPGSAFLVLTHDHALDFLIVAEALKRTDAAYVGMIGSKTKRATFASWYRKEVGGDEAELARLVCPIGGDGVKDKRPAVIAAMAAAEVMLALSAR